MLSIIVPAYNEEKSIKQIIQDLKNLDFEKEIIVVNDASTDKTKEILEKIDGIKLINHRRNMGYGASLKTGIEQAKNEYILIIDSDGTYPIESIKELKKHIPEYDMVIGARKKYRPFYGIPAKWFLNKFASYLTENKVLDLNSGLRIFKKQIVLDHWNLFPQRFSFTSTLTMICLTNEYEVKNVKIDYLKRTGKSKLKPIQSFKRFIGLILKLALYFKPLKVFIPLSVLLFFIGLIIFFYSLFFTEKIFDTTIATFIISSIQMFAIGMMADLIVKNTK
ncbi:glycosyltransferase family 2 protein [Patescibacteria group bacterium]|nr:glycosyltransferase family 2 protein [Patescibacteria group bacterium]